MRRYPVLLAFFASLAFFAVAAPGQEGPTTDSTQSVAKPRKPNNNPADSQPAPSDEAPIPSKLSKKAKGDEPKAEASFTVNSQLVNLDVSVLDDKGHFIPGIPKGNFRILEDNVPQQISTFGAGEGAMTVCLLIEFSNKFQWYGSPTWYQTLVATYGFVQTLKPDDYVAVIAYDMKPEILSDFSNDRQKTQEALSRLRIPGFSEANLFDALTDAQERMKNIEGRKAIVLLSSGVDTFSRLTFDKTRKIVQEDAVPVYAIGLMQALRIMAESNMSGPQELTFLQADNQMKTFAKETGGMSFFPRFYGEFGSIYQAISQSLRNQYSLGYNPTNQAHDGKFRKIKVELVNPEGQPLVVKNEKGKPVKYQVIAKAGYTAPREVE